MSHRLNTTTIRSDELRPRRRRSDGRHHAGHGDQPIHGTQPQLAIVRPVAKTALVPGTVIWAHVQFEETSDSKLRPAVVRSVTGRDVTIFPATTAQSRHRYPWAHYELLDVASAGLHRATGLRLATTTVDIIDIVSVAGALFPEDHLALFAVGTDEAEQRLGRAA
jgi:hypothetical protein